MNDPPYLNITGEIEVHWYEAVFWEQDFGQYAFDKAGDTISYTGTSSDPPLGSMNFDENTGIFNSTPLHSEESDTPYTLTVHLVDPYTAENGEFTKDFLVYIHPNRPTVANSNLPNISVVAGFPISIDFDFFSDEDMETLQYSYNASGDDISSWFIFDNSSLTISGTPTVNSAVGEYIINIMADDGNVHSDFDVVTFELNVTENFPPEIDTPAADPPWIVAHESLSYKVQKSNYNDPEDQAITYGFSVNDTTMGSWLSMTEETTYLHFTGTPDNTQFGNFTLSILINDPYLSVNGILEDNATIWVTENQVPTLSGTPTDPPSVIIGELFNYSFDLNWITDNESEPLTHSWGINPDLGWLTCTVNSGDITFEGTTIDNTQAMDYELFIVSKDPHSDVNDLNTTINFTITINIPPAFVTVPDDQTLLVPDGLVWSYGAGLVTDDEGDPIISSLKVNGSTSIPTWLIYDLSDFSFSIVNTSNAIKDTYIVSIVIRDQFSTDTETNFTLTITENFAPVALMELEDNVVVNFNTLEITFPDKTELFNDIENRTVTYTLRLGGFHRLAHFMRFNILTNTLYCNPLDIDVGKWPLEYVATDEIGQEGIISFNIEVVRKNYCQIILSL